MQSQMCLGRELQREVLAMEKALPDQLEVALEVF